MAAWTQKVGMPVIKVRHPKTQRDDTRYACCKEKPLPLYDPNEKRGKLHKIHCDADHQHAHMYAAQQTRALIKMLPIFRTDAGKTVAVLHCIGKKRDLLSLCLQPGKLPVQCVALLRKQRQRLFLRMFALQKLLDIVQRKAKRFVHADQLQRFKLRLVIKSAPARGGLCGFYRPFAS